MIFDGKWQVNIATPLGKQAVIFEITTQDGAIRGTAQSKDEIVQFQDPLIDGKRLTWSQSVTKPLKLNLKFDVTVDGDQLNGTAKANFFPASLVTGERVV